jgi:hypothetical protein
VPVGVGALLQARLLQRLLGGNHCVGQAVVVAAGVLLVHKVTHIEVLDLHRQAQRQAGRHEDEEAPT